MERAEIEAIIRGRCGDRENIIAVYLYGSHARGTAGPRSDVDVGVLYRTVPGPGLAALSLGLEADLERDLGAPVQLLVLNTAPADLVHRVLRDGVLIVERDASTRVAFEVRARNEYFDLEPYYRESRRGPA
jgi:uncharacterized protein